MPESPKSPYKGVFWVPVTKKFKSCVTYEGRTHHCGYYDSPLEGAKARDKLIMRMGLKIELQIFKPIKNNHYE